MYPCTNVGEPAFHSADSIPCTSLHNRVGDNLVERLVQFERRLEQSDTPPSEEDSEEVDSKNILSPKSDDDLDPYLGDWMCHNNALYSVESQKSGQHSGEHVPFRLSCDPLREYVSIRLSFF